MISATAVDVPTMLGHLPAVDIASFRFGLPHRVFARTEEAASSILGKQTSAKDISGERTWR
jgi:hypothetical protein